MQSLRQNLSKLSRASRRTLEKAQVTTNLQGTQVYIHIDRALFKNTNPEDFHVKVAQTKGEIVELLEAGFEYVMQKDGLAYFRKRN